jgi:hypothetical protein
MFESIATGDEAAGRAIAAASVKVDAGVCVFFGKMIPDLRESFPHRGTVPVG